MLDSPAEGKLRPMRLASPDFIDNQAIPSRFTCDGDNLSPGLTITAVPEEAKSLALIVDDPDAAGGTWVHWLVWNIPPETQNIEAGLMPAGAVEGMNSFGESSYDGPCPPDGFHRYFFKLYALDTTIDLPITATAPELVRAMTGHLLEETHLVGIYSRS